MAIYGTTRHMTAAEAAGLLGISPRHLLRLALRREIASVRLGPRSVRFRGDDVERYALRHRVAELRDRG